MINGVTQKKDFLAEVSWGHASEWKRKITGEGGSGPPLEEHVDLSQDLGEGIGEHPKVLQQGFGTTGRENRVLVEG